MIYFIQGDITRLIKIGRTDDATVEARVRSLKVGSPDLLRVLGVARLGNMEQTRQLERDLHKRFAGQRKHGEWFAETPELLETIKRLCDPVTTEQERLAARWRETEMRYASKNSDAQRIMRERRFVIRREPQRQDATP